MRRRLDEQVVVITGASSGIGLAIAQEAAKRGARLMLTSRSPVELARVCEALRRVGAPCAWHAADLSDLDQVRQVASEAIRVFGGFDVWINNAAVSMYGRVLEEPLEDQRRLFDVNVWGTFHGCRVALEHLRSRGGAIINIGDMAGERTLFLQGTYSASKHATKAMTDVLRMELDKDDVPVTVTHVRPSFVHTPFLRHARNHLGEPVAQPGPTYAPEVVARAVIRCIERPHRSVLVGGRLARPLLVLEKLLPSVADRVVPGWLSPIPRLASRRGARKAPGVRRNAGKAGDGDGLYRPLPEGELNASDTRRRVLRRSVYTAASLHRLLTGSALAAGAALALAINARRH